MWRILILLAISITFFTCSSEKPRTIKKDFPKNIKLISIKKEINEIIRPVEMVIHNDFFIVQNDQISNMPCFYVYSLDSLKFLYSFGYLGGSEEEFVAPLITRSEKNELFSVFDQGTRYLKNYRITKDSSILISNEEIYEETKYPFQELSFVNDSIFLYLSVHNELISYNLKTKSIIDTLQFETRIKDILGSDYNTSIDFFHFSNSQNKIVTGHNFINTVTLNECSDNGKFQKTSISLLGNSLNNISPKLYDNIYYYPFVGTTSELIFAQYSGYRFQSLQPFPLNLGKRHYDFLLEVYDWELNPKVLLELDSDFLRCTIDEKNSKIYTWNPHKDFDHLLIYEYREILE